jgi:hypothetical protein
MAIHDFRLASAKKTRMIIINSLISVIPVMLMPVSFLKRTFAAVRIIRIKMIPARRRLSRLPFCVCRKRPSSQPHAPYFNLAEAQCMASIISRAGIPFSLFCRIQSLSMPANWFRIFFLSSGAMS